MRDKNLLNGPHAAQRFEIARTLRGMRVLQDDRNIAATMQQEAELMGLRRLQQFDPVQAKEVQVWFEAHVYFGRNDHPFR